MAELTEVRVPDIGDFSDVPVIEILVGVGDRIHAEDPLVTLESDKASMDVTAPEAGVVREIVVAVGDNVSEGSVLLRIATGDDGAAAGGDHPSASIGDSETADVALAGFAAGAEVAGGTPPAGASGPGAGDAAPADPAGAAAEAASRESSGIVEVRVPDIGDFSEVPVIEVLVGAGDRIRPEDPLVTLESDKATMDVPSPVAGRVAGIVLSAGDLVSEGALILTVEPAGPAEAVTPAEPARSGASAEATESADKAPAQAPDATAHGPDPSRADPVAATASGRTPDAPVDADPIGEAMPGRTSDVPAPGPRETDPIAEAAPGRTPDTLAASVAAAPAPPPGPPGDAAAPDPGAASQPDPRAPRGRPSPTAALESRPEARPVFHATPAMRRYARELGVDLARVKGTGRKGRVLREDVSGFVKSALSAPPPAAAEGTGIAPIPAVDFAKFGEVETRPLSRIKRISGLHLHRVWVNVPHVTSHDEADVTELEAFRQSIREEAAARGVRITLLAFITKAVAATLAEYPAFNASLGPDGDTLIVKKYVHVGIAVDTPNGLMVPVLRDADRKGVYDLAREMADLGVRAREGALKSDEMEGGTFTISSLGGIGGTAFTPIVNAPEVAILGVSRARTAPVWDGSGFAPRLMLPLDLSWDHRVVDGAEAARFLAHLARLLGDVRRLLL